MAQVDNTRDALVRNDTARGAAWVACFSTIMTDDLLMIDPGKFPVYEDIVERHVPARLRGLFREELGAVVFWHSKFDLEATIDKLTRGLTPEDAAAGFTGVARMLPAWTTDPQKLNEALNKIPVRNKNRLAHAMGRYFATMPHQEETIAAIGRRLKWKESFLIGCRKPFGTMMCMPPSIIN